MKTLSAPGGRQGLELAGRILVQNWRRIIPRGVALFFGLFALLNILGGIRSAHFDANVWWIDLRFLPQWVGQPLLALSSVWLIAFAVRPVASTWRRGLTSGCAAALGIVALVNVTEYYSLLLRGSITSRFPLPLSLFVAGAFAAILRSSFRAPSQAPFRGEWFRVIAITCGCAVLFPLAQMFCFGKTDYRRPADAAIVLGARVYADGRPSDALADRVRTASQLYRDGLVRKLIVSGGPGDGAVHETDTMRRMAIQLGVSSADIIVDRGGFNTQATVRNSEAALSGTPAPRLLVVSHFYHLPRIKLAFQRDGWEVYTVPARESYILRQLPFNMAREVAALWTYYFRPLAHPRG